MFENMDDVEAFVNKVKILKNDGRTERKIAELMKLQNDKGAPSVPKLRLFYSFGQKLLHNYHNTDEQFIDIFTMAEEAYHDMGGDSAEISSELKQAKFRNATIMKVLGLLEFNGYLTENKWLYTVGTEI